MTQRKVKQHDWTWTTLAQINASFNQSVTAGQVGQVMGICRNTAKKYLEELIKTGTCVRYETIGNNRMTMYTYRAVLDTD
jgi:response regulator of citrate/malate metabolism